MANKLNPELVQNIAELTNVKKISDLPIIDVIEKDNETENIRTSQQFNNSYLLSSTLIEDSSQVGGRYFNYRVKLNEVTDYLSTLSDANLSAFKKTFDFFVDSLKNNTKNSYVEFIPANDTIDTENAINNYSYTFKYNLSEVHDEVIGFSYSYIEGIGEQVSTYSYTNVLTNGLVTNATLEKYVRNSIATILGVPSTPTALSEAIDSVIEFVDWFKGYTKDKDGLNELLTKIDNKDKEIIASYTAADTEINARIDNLDVNATAVEKQYITGFTQENGLIKNVTRSEIGISDVTGLSDAINNINVDVPIDGVSTDENSFTAGGTKYTLVVDENKKLKFVKYTNTSVSVVNGYNGTSLEFDSTATEQQKTFKVKSNNAFTSENVHWYTGNSGTSAATETVTNDLNNKTSQIVVAQNGNTTIIRRCNISDGTTNATSSAITLNFNMFRLWIFQSSSPTFTINIDSGTHKPSNITNIIHNDIYSNEPEITTETTSDGYVYILMLTSWNTKDFYFGSTFPETRSAKATYNIYSDNKGYTLYRSEQMIPSGKVVRIHKD